MPKKFNVQEHIASFNRVKSTLNKTFTLKELREELKKEHLPSNKHFLSILSVMGIIQRETWGVYSFKSKEPLHYSGLQRVYDSYSDKIREWKSNSKSTPKKSVEMTEESAIKLLKGLGYKILKPVFEEI